MTSPGLLLSIVVPTRDRLTYASALLDGLHRTSPQNFEIIIQDNSTDTRLGDYASSLNDQRIKYQHSSQPMNMHQNFDRAIARASGDYICALGDDDAILLDVALRILNRAKELNSDAVLTPPLIYNWPGVRHWFWGDVGGQVTVTGAMNTGECILDPQEELEQVFTDGITKGLGLLPRVYQGFVSRHSLHALYMRCGTYFPGPSPDMANAVGLVPFVNRILHSPRAAVISGHSPRSGGGSGAAGKHHGKLEDQAHLPTGTIENWDPAIPRFWSGLTIYAQSAIMAARATSDLSLSPIAYHKLCAACLVYESRNYRRDVLKAAFVLEQPRIFVAIKIILSTAQAILVRSANFARNLIVIGLKKRFSRPFGDIGEVLATYSEIAARE